MSSLISAAIAVNLSNSVFSFATSNAPADGKSVVLAREMSLVITTVLPPLIPVTSFPAVVVIVPVDPSPPVTV